MKNIHEITLTNKATYEAIGELCSGNCEPVANDEGYVFSSIVDAARYAGVSPQNMWNHLNSPSSKTCKGHVYFYVRKRDESFGRIMKRLSEVNADAERRKEIHKRLQDKTEVAERRVIEAEMELEALLDQNEQEVA